MRIRVFLSVLGIAALWAAVGADAQNPSEGAKAPPNAAAPAAPVDHLQMGDQLLREQKYKEAVEELKMASAVNPLNPDIHLRLGIAYGSLNDADSSLKHLQHTVALEPENPLALLLLAQEYAARKNYDVAWVLSRRAEKLGMAPQAAGLMELLKKNSKEPAPDSVTMPVFEKPAPPAGPVGNAVPVAAPAAVRVKPIDANILKVKMSKVLDIKAGDVFRTYPFFLAWSPDDQSIAIHAQQIRQDPDGKRWADPGNKTQMHWFEYVPATRTFRPLEGFPSWGAQYWNAKSAEASPGGTLKVEKRTEAKFGISGYQEYLVNGHVVGKYWKEGRDVAMMTAPGQETEGANVGGIGDGVEDARGGESLGQAPAVPQLWHIIYQGLTYSWAPPDGEAMVFVNDRAVKILDAKGVEKKIGKGDMILPAWSHDGKKIAFVAVPIHTGNWEIHIADVEGIE